MLVRNWCLFPETDLYVLVFGEKKKGDFISMLTRVLETGNGLEEAYVRPGH